MNYVMIFRSGQCRLQSFIPGCPLLSAESPIISDSHMNRTSFTQTLSLQYAVKVPDTHVRYRDFISSYCKILGYAVAQLVEKLRYKPEGHGFDSRLSHWNFSVT
jgi:hypothetical protein